MGSKNKPGKFDCYAHAEPDEPMFVLLGRDPVAPMAVRLWAAIRAELGDTSPEKITEAQDCADAMEEWSESIGKDITAEAADRALRRVFAKLADG